MKSEAVKILRYYCGKVNDRSRGGGLSFLQYLLQIDRSTFATEDWVALNYGTPFSFRSRSDQISPAISPRDPRGFLAPSFRFGPNRSRLA